jgi:hypothetical protein
MTPRIYQTTFAVATALLSTLLSLTPASANEPADFEAAHRHARSYSIQHDDPASVAEGLARYQSVVDRFPNHPGASEAKLDLFRALTSVGDPPSLTRAAPLIAGLVPGADLATPAGRALAQEYIEFHVGHAAGHPTQDLAGASRVAESLLIEARRDQDRPLELRARSLTGKILWRSEKPRAALDSYLETLDTAFTWGKQGYWRQLWNASRTTHSKCSIELTNMAGAVAGILERTGDTALADEVRRYPHLIQLYPALQRALNGFQPKSPDESPRAETLQTHLDRTVQTLSADPSPAPPAPADRPPAVAIAPVQSSAPAPTNAPAGRWLWPIGGCAVLASAALVWFARRGRSDRGAGTT